MHLHGSGGAPQPFLWDARHSADFAPWLSKITFAGVVKAEVRNIYVGGERVSSSYFTARTKTIFRSASAKYFVFIQVCRETYEFDEDGERYYEKAMDGFLPELFERWHALKANHVVTIVLFGRVSYDPSEIELISPECLKHNEEVGWYKDFVRPSRLSCFLQSADILHRRDISTKSASIWRRSSTPAS